MMITRWSAYEGPNKGGSNDFEDIKLVNLIGDSEANNSAS